MVALREQKETFVLDLVGGPLGEIYAVVSVSVMAYLAYKVLSLETVIGESIVLDFLLNVVILLSSITIYSGDIATLYQGLLVPIVIVLIVKLFTTSKLKTPSKKLTGDNDFLPRKAFLTAYRSHMLILTNFAILAVDFHIFPRRFAKVETWGTSIMDMGVGSFVFSLGLVSSRALLKQELAYSSKKKFQLAKYIELIFLNTKKSIPMLVFGIIRLLSVKGLEYQEHVTEYGVHWNFFITLGLVPIIIAVLDPLFIILPRFLVASLITIVYEVALSRYGLLNFILRPDNRMENIVTMNKEGLFSLFGYLSIFIFGLSFGSFVLPGKKYPNNLISLKVHARTGKSWLTVSATKGLLITTILYMIIASFVKESPLFYNISRRLANLPYVFMIVAYNSFFLLCYKFCGDLLGDSDTNSEILEAVNKNGLVFFLLGNLLTGLVNMSINTLQCDTWLSFLILFAYGLVLTVLSVALDKLGIYIKI